MKKKKLSLTEKQVFDYQITLRNMVVLNPNKRWKMHEFAERSFELCNSVSRDYEVLLMPIFSKFWKEYGLRHYPN